MRTNTLPISAVERVVRVVEIVPLPGAPAAVRGLINFQGKITPVFDMRVRLGHPRREAQLSDHLIIAQTKRRRVAVLVDSVSRVIDIKTAAFVPAANLLPDAGAITGAVKIQGNIILIHDLDAFLSVDEQGALEAATPE